MKTILKVLAGAFAPALIGLSPAFAEEVLWAVQVEQLEYRVGEDENVAAFDFDAYAGTDELKLVWRTEGEYSTDERAWETLENQLRVQVPVSPFFDAVAGVRVDTPEGENRVHAVLGLHGLAPQWFEVDADLFVSEYPSLRLEAEYEGLITNRIILVPSIELDVPFRDDLASDIGAFGPKLEVGLRLSYDLIDRAFSPYIGVHYERVFGETADIARRNGEDNGTVFFVAGARILY